ncbi:ATPase [Gemmiger sp.]|uniref:ATPase n=1 Tax=Gemmiger sp. TaxID=2049027 RepID=UPI003F06FE4C|nr:ATPase [bacterium]MCI7792827.1 ATPase [bacterium]MDD5857663.1 ATPase [bacterium]
MNVEELLDLMEETLEEGTSVPFAATKRVVDVERCRDIIDEVRNNLPDELRDSKKIVSDREQIVRTAQQEADNIIKQAEERARVLVSDQEITKRAQKAAVEIVNAAQNQAKELNRASATYCESILKNSEEVLARSVADIKNTRMNLRNVASRDMRGAKKPKP